MSIARHIREIGRGKDGTRSLTREDAFDLMSQVLAGSVSDLEVGAFAVAMRIKGESLPELLGFLDATHAHCRVIPVATSTVLLPSYNGARKLANLTPLLALLLARAGVQVLVHGSTEAAGRTTSSAIFQALGLPVARDVGEVQRAWDRAEPAFMTIDDLCPPLGRLLAVRQVIGLRNSGHTLAKLLLPCTGGPAVRVVNYTHPEYAALLRGFLAETGGAAMLMRGTEGEPVADSRRPTPSELYIGGQARPDVDEPPEADAEPPGSSRPFPMDAIGTAHAAQAVLRNEEPAPAAISRQVRTLLRMLAAMPQPVRASSASIA